MTMAQTLEVVHGLMNNVKVVMNGMQRSLTWLRSLNQGVLSADGKASMDGIWRALGMLLPHLPVVLAEI